MAYQFWLLYGECDRDLPYHTKSCFANPGAVSYNTTFHQRVSDIVNWGICLDVCVIETGPSCMSFVQQSFESPSFTHPCCRCDKTAFFEALVTAEAVLVAQVVLTLRFVFFGRDGFILITTEWNRIYAVTNKNRMITSCFCVISISQFILGLYITSYAAMRGGKPLTKYYSRFLLTVFQRNPLYRSHFRFIWYAYSWNMVPWMSDSLP